MVTTSPQAACSEYLFYSPTRILTAAGDLANYHLSALIIDLADHTARSHANAMGVVEQLPATWRQRCRVLTSAQAWAILFGEPQAVGAATTADIPAHGPPAIEARRASLYRRQDWTNARPVAWQERGSPIHRHRRVT